MSTASEQWTSPTPPASPGYDTATAAVAVEAYFARVAASGVQPRLKPFTGVCQFDVAPVGSWCVRLKDGLVRVTKGPAGVPPARCVVSCGVADFLHITSHEDHMNIMTAVLQELVMITGDIPFAYAVLGSFVFTPGDGQPEMDLGGAQ